MTVACSESNEPDAPALTAPEIMVDQIMVGMPNQWLTQGSDFSMAITDLSFTSTVENTRLATVKLMRGDEVLVTEDYTPGMELTTRIVDWPHGENNLTLSGTFIADDWEITHTLFKTHLIVFNELPEYNIEGLVKKDVKWMASNGEQYQHYIEMESIDHIFTMPYIKWIASNGEKFVFDSVSADMTPTFFLSPEKTNFDATITSTKLHWGSFEGPSELGEETLPFPVNLYGEFTVSGEHEGINIHSQSVITFRYEGPQDN